MRSNSNASASLAASGKGRARSKTKRTSTTSSTRKSKSVAKSSKKRSAYFEEARNLLSVLGNGLWSLFRQIRLLVVFFNVLQSLLFRLLSLLQWVNDFPTRMQFRRTTQRFLSVMNTTESYATFVDAAASLDHYCGVAQWAQEAPPSEKCDAIGLLVDATAARQLIRSHNVAGMEIFLCSLLKRNAHGLMDPSIYNFFNCPKYCIEDYTRSMESLISAYAGTSAEPRTGSVAHTMTPSDDINTPSPSSAGAATAAAPSTSSSSAASAAVQVLRPCWVRMDDLESTTTSTTNPISGSGSNIIRGKGPLYFTSGKPSLITSAAATTTTSALPAVDITAKIRQAWRYTASTYATAKSQQLPPHTPQPPVPQQLAATSSGMRSSSQRPPHVFSRQSSYAVGKFSRLNSGASTLAPTPEHPPNNNTNNNTSSTGSGSGGSLGRTKGSSRLLLGSASVGDESNYLTEDEQPTPSGGSALGTSAATAAVAAASSLLVSVKSGLARVGTRNDVVTASTSTRHSPASPSVQSTAESPLQAHIEASCNALHRFMDGCSTTNASVSSPLMPSPQEQPSLSHRIRVLRQVLHSFGRTALVLSGGASMGTYHAGVARALYEAEVMPDILCGSSAGSIIAALICTKTPAELKSFMQSDVLSTEAMQMSPFGEDASLAEKLRRFFKTGFLMDVKTLMECMRGQCGDLTFLEAYELSGKVLNVSVTRSQFEGTHADRHALLNYVTAPDVVIWSAVSASCALPGLFTAVQLIEKPPSAASTFAPYLPGELWCDGSVAQDIPRRLLTQLFGVDYLIVSQVNPYVIPFLKPPSSDLVVSTSPSVVSKMWFVWVAMMGWVLTVLFSLRLLPRTGAGEVLFLAFAQDYGGDVTIYPVESLLTAAPDYLNLVNNPSAEYISYVASRAQCRTWPLVTRIRLATAIERRLLQELHCLEKAAYAECREFLTQ